MKFDFKKKYLKVVAFCGLALALLIPAVLNMTHDVKADEVDGIPMYDVTPIYKISRNDGGGAYGTHTYPSYTEDGVQYYRTGDIIEVDIALPQGHGSTAYSDVVKYDATKLELVSSYRDIKASMSRNYADLGWNNAVSMYDGNIDQIMHNAAEYDANEWQGGTVAKMYFRVKAGVETEEGVAITFEFPFFQSASYVNGKTVYTHAGSPESDRYVSAPITIIAKTPSQPVVKPEITLTDSEVTVYEGDIVNPKDYIVSATDSSDPNVSKELVAISEGTGNFGAHQPVKGTYTFKYTITNTSGQTTEKELTLKVLERTYEVKSVNVDAKKIFLAAGTPDTELETLITKLKTEKFSVTVACNDGSEFEVDGTVISGETDRYLVDDKNNLVEQEFGIKVKLGLPLVSYNTNGEREIIPYGGTMKAFVGNIGTGETEATVSVVITKQGTGGDGGNTDGNNDGNTGGSGNNPSSNKPNPSSNSTNTGDTTNMIGFMALAMLSLVVGGSVYKGYKRKQLG